MLGKYYNNSILTTNSRTKNKTANSGLTDYTKEMATDKDEATTEEDHVTAEELICHLIDKSCAICIAKQDAGLTSILSRNDNNYKRDFGGKFSLPRGK